ncbi:MAG: C39 family peptidase, partial [Clostridiaceae bacterium]
EKIILDKKMKEAEKYVTNKRKSINSEVSAQTYGSSRILSMTFPSYAQQLSTNCGPAAAYNAIKYKNIVTVDYQGNPLSQTTLGNSTWLNYDGQTTFGSRWPMTMNAWAPGNNYARLSSSGYSAADWRNKLMNCVIWTIDKGYPVIADTKQHTGATSINLSSKYATDYYNAKDCYHYVVIYGYNDLTKTLFFSDSHASFNGLYAISLYDMASLTDDFGIVW